MKNKTICAVIPKKSKASLGVIYDSNGNKVGSLMDSEDRTIKNTMELIERYQA